MTWWRSPGPRVIARLQPTKRISCVALATTAWVGWWKWMSRIRAPPRPRECHRLSNISGSEQATTTSVSITVAGSGFETPALGSGANAYQYHPTGSSWTFGPNSGFDSNNNIVGGSGITGNNSGFTSSNPAAPEGAQVAFLQGGSANYISQSLSGFQAGRELYRQLPGRATRKL